MHKRTEYSRYRRKPNDFKDYAISSFDKNLSLAPYLCIFVLFLSGCSFIQEQPSEQITTAPSRILKLNYEGFILWLDCNKRGVVKFRYKSQRDTGSFKRYNRFFLDPNVPSECQQTSTKAYGNGYDRGHLVPANHLDYSESAIKSSNNMTNILPQFSVMNRGAWELTEEIIECYRDIDQLLVIGGVIWGNNPDDDYFIQSHGIRTPDAFWKVVIRGAGQNEQANAWVVPNSSDATKKELNEYLVSIDDLEEETGEKIPVADYVKHDKPDRSWMIPYGCDRS